MTARPDPRRASLLGAACLLAFVVGAVIWLPASLALRFLPAPLTCAAPLGTLWRGRCDDLRHGGVTLGAVAWRVHALPLMALRLEADLDWERSGSRITGGLAASRDRWAWRSIRGTVDVSTLRALPFWPSSMVGDWPPGEGRLRLDVEALEIRGHRLARAVGVIEADDLVSLGRERWMLGDYRLAWQEGTTPLGVLNDRGGPLELQARLGPSPQGAWTLTGRVRARDPAWRTRLQVFGPADSAGNHALSVEWR